MTALSCGHPLTARAIRSVDGDLVTLCWACEVADSIVAESRERADRLRTYNREAKRASRARAKGYNEAEGSGLESHKVSPDARLSATTREAGVTASVEVVAR